MPLADASDKWGPNKAQTWESKVDKILATMPKEDVETLRGWLEDPEWSSHAISKALESYSKAEGQDFTVGHPTVDRWRMHYGIKVKLNGSR